MIGSSFISSFNMLPAYKRLLIKTGLLLAPFCLLVVFYFCADPFKVLYHYSAYYADGQNAVTLSRDYVSVQTLLQHIKRQPVDSFIFGNSRTLVYPVSEWRKYIKSSGCLHLDASAETLEGIHAKVKLLQNLNLPIRNALIPLDYDTIKLYKNQGHIFARHPVLTGQSWLTFQTQFIKAYFTPEFLLAYIPYKITGQLKPYMVANFQLESRSIAYDVSCNEMSFPAWEEEINRDVDAYYRQKAHIFYQRPNVPRVSPPAIEAEQKKLLLEISNILRANNTDCRVVINPLYDQKALNRADVAFLENLFGQTHVYNYSGSNHFTMTLTNYYESSHYRRHVAQQIIREIYTSPGANN